MTIEFGKIMKSYRRDSRLNQQQLANQIEMDPTTIGKLEKGTREPSPQTALKLISALDVPITNQAEFLLYAAGHSSETTREVLDDSLQRQPDNTVTLVRVQREWLMRIPSGVNLTIEQPKS